MINFFKKGAKNLNRHFTHDSKQIAFKDVNYISHQGNGNEYYSEILPYIHQNDYDLKRLAILNVDKDVEQLELSYIPSGNVIWFNHFEKTLW